MIPRLFWLLVGALLGVAALRKLDELTQQARPANVAERTGRRVGGTQARWRDALAAGRDAARSHEDQLRSTYGVPSLAELAQINTSDEPHGDVAGTDAHSDQE